MRCFNFVSSFKLRLFSCSLWCSGLGNYFLWKRLAVKTLLWSLKFVIKINLKHDTIAVYIFIFFTNALKPQFFHEKVISEEEIVLLYQVQENWQYLKQKECFRKHRFYSCLFDHNGIEK